MPSSALSSTASTGRTFWRKLDRRRIRITHANERLDGELERQRVGRRVVMRLWTFNGIGTHLCFCVVCTAVATRRRAGELNQRG